MNKMYRVGFHLLSAELRKRYPNCDVETARKMDADGHFREVGVWSSEHDSAGDLLLTIVDNSAHHTMEAMVEEAIALVDRLNAERTPESVTPDRLPMNYNNIIEWLARDILGSTEAADQIEGNVDRYVEDLTGSIQSKATEIGV